jgi:sulfur-oxidizing protein SoxY
MAARYYAGGPILFDPAVRVTVPASAEDQFQVPVTVDATGLTDVREIVIVADLNPIQHVLSFRPDGAQPWLSFRMKVEQTTAIRAGVRLADGSWHMGVAVVEAAGGGCSAPAGQYADQSWTKRLGETRAQIVREPDGAARLTMRVRHPMDTGLAAGIPVFHLERVDVTTATGASLGRLDLHEPVAENPTLTLKARLPAGTSGLDVRARDTDGNEFRFSVPVPAKAS